MKDVAEHRHWIKAATTSSLKRFSIWRRIIKITLVIGGGFLAAAASASANLVAQDHKWLLHYSQIFGGVLVLIGGVFMEFVDEGAADAIKRADELADLVDERDGQIDSLGSDFEWFTRLYSTASALFYIVEGVAVSGAGSESDQKLRYGAMLDVMVAEKATLFGMSTDRWNFAIYLFSAETSMLQCVACRRPIRAEEVADHRSWKPGEGHVGIAFQTRREIVASDTSEPEARSLFDAPDPSRRDDDRSRYRSIASIPIKLGGDDPIGIIVATSDVVGRFRIRQRGESAADPVEPLRILANALAMVIKIADFQKDQKGMSS